MKQTPEETAARILGVKANDLPSGLVERLQGVEAVTLMARAVGHNVTRKWVIERIVTKWKRQNSLPESGEPCA